MRRSPERARLYRVAGQPSWRLASPDVELYVTRAGGHLGPVTFDRTRRPFQPYSVAPWCQEKLDRGLPTLIRSLRGDFFCAPFGGNAEAFGAERHPPHGESANARWSLVEAAPGRLHLRLRTKVRPGRVDKFVEVRPGHSAVYQRHVLSGMSGPMNPGHHAMLKFPDEPGSGVVSTSPFVWGQVYPGGFENPAQGGYCALRAGARFTSLEKVPLLTGGTTDVTRYPARRGFEDLVYMVSDPDLPFAWTAVSFPRERRVWFALKDPRVLRQTILWISNGGRHYAPWNGRHVGVMGLEELTGYFHEGLAPSARPNALTRQGIPTCLQLDPQRPTVINYIMVAASIPAGFDRVAAIEPTRAGVALRSDSGRVVRVPVDMQFLAGGREGP